MMDTCSYEHPCLVSSQNTEENLSCDDYNNSSTIDCNTTIAEGDRSHRKKSQTKCILSLYTCPPTGEFPLEELYACTKQRYKLLQILSDIGDCEPASERTWIPTFVAKLSAENIEEFRQIVLNDFVDESVEFLTGWDVVSHFAMRTACSRLFESLKWFLKQEIKLFHIRWYLMTVPQREMFMESNGITLNKVPKDERLALFARFLDTSLINDLYKTRFCRASKLFKTRTVYLVDGWVYFKADQAVYPIADLYEEYLNRSLRRAKAKYHYFDFDSKYSFFFRRISEEIKLSLFKFSPCSQGRVEIKDLDALSLTSHPLCMSNLHYFLKRQSHLRNGGRLQYNLFLKGIGLSLFDAIKFWRDIFTKKIPLEHFTRDYLYGIRHNYGKLGKQADYPPLSCARILDSSPGPLDRHGCPFQRADKKELYLQLKRYGLSDDVMDDVWTLVENNVPQQACARVFELKHGVTHQQATAHPNIYYIKSRAIINKRLVESNKLQENQSVGLKPKDNQSLDTKHQENQSIDIKHQGNQSLDTKHQENQSLDTKHQENQSLDTKHQENQSLDTKHQGNQSLDTKHQENQSLDTKHQGNQSLDTKHQENQSLDTKHQENQSLDTKHQENQSLDTKHQGNQSLDTKHQENQSLDTKHQGNQSLDTKHQENQSLDTKHQENQSLDTKHQENQSLDTKHQGNQSLDTKHQENQSLDTKHQGNQSLDTKHQENQSLDTKHQGNQSLDTKHQENQSLDTKHQENQSLDTKHQESQLIDIKDEEKQFDDSKHEGKHLICLKSGQELLKISNLDSEMLESKSIKTEFCANCSCSTRTLAQPCQSQINKLEW